MRLTPSGVGVLLVLVSVGAAWLDRLVFDGPGVLFGLVFVLTSAWCAARVRDADLAAAPIAAPLAFALALVATSGGAGLAGRVLALVSALSELAGWLYGGTAVCVLLALLRRRALRVAARRAAQAQAHAQAQTHAAQSGGARGGRRQA
ncbi:DUF6542 domain-containing protein [Allostreptomyces psammosilenae]|uniref:DUF6542 domain-containing protein n=1 Tax=Allostreptomyces psammosilenae TaxID=1892865 RepID=A0A853A1P0_9ACTN|nr:DUF6542 domain-containing protein [Allostreptomyces psammosilenae]NYI08057.1 hypothetical protein [Allostreptomyces psammosilenae]